MPSIPLAGSPSPMAAPSGASGEGQTGQNGAGEDFAALLALLAGGGPLPQGVLPGIDTSSAGPAGQAQTAAPAAAAGTFPAQALLAAQTPAQGQLPPVGQDRGAPLFPAQLAGQFQLGIPAGQSPAQGIEGMQAVPAGPPPGAGTTTAADAAALAAFAATADATSANTGTGVDGLTAQSAVSAAPSAAGTAPADAQQPQTMTDQTVTAPAPAAGSGAGTATGGDDSRQPDAKSGPVAEVTGPAAQAVPQSFATTQAAAVERVSTPAPQQPAPPASQVAVHVLPLRLDPDGIQRLTVHLHPADLGPVSVVAELRNGAVHLQLAGTSDAAFEALRSALPDLKQELEDGGFSSATLDLQREAPGGQPGQDRRPLGQQDPAARGNAPAGRTGDVYAAPADEPPPVRPGSRLLNVRL
ncbi:flagellar hook-length control protein FliK [Planomonospora venezuelensis]|uniref:Flagellar hook-length control protein FliK n=1 Tax=Planomonospora venezuelensis TaxID=1999 RepID=A0A841DG78_PLAVE|nr:flagellar hook-length control protein FliK [Planomonospora venezuelensis]